MRLVLDLAFTAYDCGIVIFCGRFFFSWLGFSETQVPSSLPLCKLFFTHFSVYASVIMTSRENVCVLFFFLVVSKMKIKISKEAMSIFFTAYLGC